MFRSDFSKYEICSESFTKTLYGQVFGKWMHFQIILSLWELEVMTDLLCAYCWKIFEQIVTVAYLKKVICKKRCLKNFANFTGNHLCWSLFIIRSPATFFKRDFDTDILRWNLQSSEEYLFWRAIVNLCMLLYLHRCFSLQCMKRLWWRFTKTVNIF